MSWPFVLVGCILLKFYIKPQPIIFSTTAISSCILLKFYIKPQLYRVYTLIGKVVSY